MKVPPKLADAFVQQLANEYVADQTKTWWWEALKVPATRICYGKSDGLTELARLVGDKLEAMLIVMDDEQRPWPVYSGKVHDIIQVLRNCRFFEYALASRDLSWIIFDTHLNELVSAWNSDPSCDI